MFGTDCWDSSQWLAIIPGKEVIPHFQQARLPKICSRGNVESVDVTGSCQDFVSFGVPFKGYTLQVKSSNVSVNRLICK